ncbi:MAG: TetR/AcrR family transcriptional regulator [Pseudomonadota bacterium]
MEQELTAREALSIRIRESLIVACGDLLVEGPIDAITITSIVEKAGVAKGSFYNHFPDKETLAAEVAKEIRGEVEARIAEANKDETDPVRKMANGMCSHVQLTVTDLKKATIMLRGHQVATTGDYPLNRNIQAHVDECVKLGRIRKSCRKTAILQILGSVYFTCLRVIEDKLSPRDAVDLCTGVFTVMLYGFGVEEKEAKKIVSEAARKLLEV